MSRKRNSKKSKNCKKNLWHWKIKWQKYIFEWSRFFEFLYPTVRYNRVTFIIVNFKEPANSQKTAIQLGHCTYSTCNNIVNLPILRSPIRTWTSSHGISKRSGRECISGDKFKPPGAWEGCTNTQRGAEYAGEVHKFLSDSGFLDLFVYYIKR